MGERENCNSWEMYFVKSFKVRQGIKRVFPLKVYRKCLINTFKIRTFLKNNYFINNFMIQRHEGIHNLKIRKILLSRIHPAL